MYQAHVRRRTAYASPIWFEEKAMTEDYPEAEREGVT
jgi:hypothetical protein